MAGRGGRGRGKGRGFTFDVGALGFGRGEALPTAIVQPPPLFPPQEKKPLPLRSSTADDYLLALKQEFRGCMRESAYFLKPDIADKDIERYSDRYREKPPDEPTIDWEPDWRYFPSELKIRVRKRRLHVNRGILPNVSSRRKSDDVSAKLEQLEELVNKEDNTTQGATGEDAAGNSDDDEEEEEEEYDEEEQEEENDYLVSHFDDDDDVGYGDDDDNDEGPTY
ncbi:DNA-directed RNA polymerase III subunit RPC7-like [Nematostella vectensis]|uniref:DNA-directed RNA polymerase III subunit RPC7-like n=1 Tax=Nematostella vectensis TaxID=45351 RepID=UPI0020775C75|nr:DNA-directed RNA polymerase III subunit RPC7-like [Nematostella vectensis]